MVFGPDGNLYVVGRFNNRVVRYDSTSGGLIGVFASNNLSQPFGLRFGGDGQLYVASGNDNSVQRFDGMTGGFLNTVVASGSGSLNLPVGLLFGPDGNLYVASFNNNRIVWFNPTNGAYLGDFVAAGSGGLNGPNFMIFRPPPDAVVSPTLTVFLSDTNVSLAWETNSVGFGLEETTAISSNVLWVSVTNSVVLTNSSNTVALPLGLGSHFFRLMKP
jgi:DNA-binding beta-propeller fold protein YncE